MTTFLDDEWFAAGSGTTLPGSGAEASGTIAVVVTRAPGGDARARIVLDRGTVVEAAREADDGAVVELSLSYADAIAMLEGRLDPSVAFMQGRLKVAGDMGVTLALLAASDTDEWSAARERVRAVTEVPEPHPA